MFPYIYMESGVSYSKVSQIVEVIVSSDIIVHFRKAPIIHLSKFHFLGVIHIFRVDGCTYKELLILIAVFYKKDGEIYKPFPHCLFPRVKTKKLCTKSMHIVLYCIE